MKFDCDLLPPEILDARDTAHEVATAWGRPSTVKQKYQQVDEHLQKITAKYEELPAPIYEAKYEVEAGRTAGTLETNVDRYFRWARIKLDAAIDMCGVQNRE